MTTLWTLYLVTLLNGKQINSIMEFDTQDHCKVALEVMLDKFPNSIGSCKETIKRTT